MTYRTHFVRTGIALALTATLLPVTAMAQRDIRPARILVKGVAGLDEGRLAKILERYEARAERRLRNSNVRMVEVPPGQERAIARALAAHSNIAFAEVDELVEPIGVVDDPSYPSQWHLPLMKAPDAWLQANGQDITVAVCDTGVNVNHADLAGQTVPGYNTASNNTETADVHGHGTWVSGVVAAAANNGIGVASVAPGARVMAMRITDRTDGYAYFSDMAECVRWAADQGARVANISFGGVPGSATVADAASYMRNKGGLVVVAAGNDGADMGYTNSPYLYTAAATTSTDAKASYSNFGAYVDIAAPGSSIYTTDRGGGYASVSGTSFASPNAAATAALVMSANPTLSPDDVTVIIGKTAVDLGTAGYDPIFGAGRVNALAAVQEAAVAGFIDRTAPNASVTSPRTGVTVSDLLSVEVSANDNIGVTRVDLLIDGNVVDSETQQISAGVYRFGWDSNAVSDGPHSLSAVAVDAAGNRGTASAISLQVANSSDTQAPVATITSPADGSMLSGSATLAASGKDDVGVTKVSIYFNGQLKCEGTATASCSVSLRKLTGTQTVTAKAFDAAGNNSSHTVQFTVATTSTKVSRTPSKSSSTSSWFSSWFED